MAVPPLDADDRRAALRQAAHARHVRAEVKQGLKSGELTIPTVLKRASEEPAIANMRVVDVIEAMPSYGPVRAAALMERLRIAPSRRIRGLGVRQRAALVAAFGTAG
ncbi:MAG: integration host factor, actinobacterial type [Nitriliruptoraceae bacterium]